MGQAFSLFIMYYFIKSDNQEFVYVPLTSYVIFWGLGFGGTLPIYNNEYLCEKGNGVVMMFQWIFAGIIAQALPILMDGCCIEDILIGFGLFTLAVSVFVQIACFEVPSTVNNNNGLFNKIIKD